MAAVARAAESYEEAMQAKRFETRDDSGTLWLWQGDFASREHHHLPANPPHSKQIKESMMQTLKCTAFARTGPPVLQLSCGGVPK